MPIAEPWNSVFENWLRSDLMIRSGVTHDAISAFESKYSVVLPIDVREYFLLSDGTGDEMDSYLNRFWPLADLVPVREAWNSANVPFSDNLPANDYFIFADHCISCWDYALKLTDDPMQDGPVIRITGHDTAGEQMASSFRGFMTEYAVNPENII